MARRAEAAEPVRQGSSVRLLLDEMYPPALAEKLRAQGHDIVAVTEDPDLVDSDDETVLAYANTAQRCLVTKNVQDFTALAKHTTHHGMLFAHPRRWPRDSSGIARLAIALDRTIREECLPGTDESRWLT